MARVTVRHPEDFPASLRDRIAPEALAHPTGLGSLRAWAGRPDLAEALLDFQAAVARATSLPPRLLETVRLRIAFHNQCRSCMSMRSQAAIDDGLTEELVCELAHPDESTDLDARELAALRYADLVATAPQDIDDVTFDELRRHFSEEEVIELGLHVGFCLGFGRIAMSWDLVDDLSEGIRRPGTVGPWDAEPVLRPR